MKPFFCHLGGPKSGQDLFILADSACLGWLLFFIYAFKIEIDDLIVGKRCFIKTGSKDGPAKGKTFFICGNQQEQCSFAMPARLF